jgi:hypothetical protein
MINIKKIIKEELDYFESGKWIEELPLDPLSWLRINFSDLSVQNTDKWYDKKYSDESGWVFVQDSKNKEIWFSYDRIWSKLELDFSLNYLEIKEILTQWVEEDYKLKGFTPANQVKRIRGVVEEDYKLKGFTPLYKKVNV